jgi:uncharacterized membrane protein
MAPADPDGDPRGLAEHESQSVQDLARLYRAHTKGISSLQQAMERATALMGRPGFAVLLGAAVLAWIAYGLTWGGGVTRPAFIWLELSATIMALLVAILILVTQRREDDVAERRAQLTLELALLADRKNAKIIALLEELRRDAPNLADRDDAESQAMSRPADPKAVLEAINREAPPTTQIGRRPQ